MNNPVVTIEMQNGKIIKAELYPDKAPNTVNNFISLIKSGFYDELTFHRIVKGFVIQGGDPAGMGYGGPGYCIKGEFSQNGFKANDIKHVRGVLSAYLDGQYAGFGKVIEGMEVVDEIASVNADRQGYPSVPQIMKKVTVETFGIDYPQPKKC